MVEFLDRITPGMDAETAKTFQRALTKQGIEFRLGAKVTGAKASKKNVSLTLEPVAGGEAQSLEADYVLLAIGRRPFTDGLGLESVGDRRPTSAASSPPTTSGPPPRASGPSGT